MQNIDWVILLTVFTVLILTILIFLKINKNKEGYNTGDGCVKKCRAEVCRGPGDISCIASCVEKCNE